MSPSIVSDRNLIQTMSMKGGVDLAYGFHQPSILLRMGSLDNFKSVLADEVSVQGRRPGLCLFSIPPALLAFSYLLFNTGSLPSHG